MPGLTFAFFTPSFNFVTSISLRSAVPANLQLTKYFFQPQIDELQREMDEAKALGFAAAQEWYKGLEKAGKDRLSDSLRWEQWEASGGPQRLLNRQTPLSVVTSPDRPGPSIPSSFSHSSYAHPPDGTTRAGPQANGLPLTMATHYQPPAPGKSIRASYIVMDGNRPLLDPSN